MSDKPKRIGTTFFLITGVFMTGTAALCLVRFGNPDLVSKLTEEDSAVETLSALFYLIGFIFCIVASFRNKRKILPVAWAVLCLIFLGEETSWFQRILGYSVPWIENANVQNEFNFHNIEALQGGSLTDSPIGIGTLLKSQNLFRLGFFTYFIAIPILLAVTGPKKIESRIGYRRPGAGFTISVVLITALSFLLAISTPADIRSALAETREMVYALIILLYIIFCIMADRKYDSPTASSGLSYK